MADPENTKPFYNSAIPGDWEVRKFRDVCESILDGTHFSPKSTVGPFKYITSKNIRNEGLILSNVGFISLEEHQFIYKRCPVKKGDILLTKDGASTGACCLNSLEEEFSLLSSVAALRVNQSKVNNQFLLQFIKSPVGQKIITDEISGQAITRITLEKIKAFKILLPPLSEQKAIAGVLGLMDGAINQNNQLIAQKELRKKWLMQNLLTGKKRLKGFSGEWEPKQLGAVAHESAARNKSSMTSVSLMAVTKASGIVPMRERVQGHSVMRCKVIEKDSFAYNPMRLNIGSIARWTESRRAMVSGDYVVFRCDETQLDPNYLDFFRKTNIWKNFVDRAGDGSVRVRIYFSHLKHLKLKLPPRPEQTAIAQVLQAVDKEIHLLKTKTEKLREQKKGMMQQLLTGKKRLKMEGN